MRINVTKSSMPSYEEYCEEIKTLWNSHWLTNKGEKHCLLESKLSEFLETGYISLFVNGHLALEEAVALFKFKPGSEVITTPFTFVSTTNAIVRNGLVPRFCDINIEELITEKTVAILPVHVYRNVCDIEAIDNIAKKHGLKVIYDAAHAFGVKYKNKGIGNFGDISMFSFHATKVFNTIEGGCLSFNNGCFKQPLEDSKNFGIRDEEHCLFIGGNAKMNEFQAAMGLCNLRHISDCINKRKKLVDIYKKRLSNVKGIVLCDEQRDVLSNYSYMPVLFDGYVWDRDVIRNKLANQGIGARKYFYPLTNELECYSEFDKGHTPNALHASTHVLTLPLYSDLDEKDVNYICDIILGAK